MVDVLAERIVRPLARPYLVAWLAVAIGLFAAQSVAADDDTAFFESKVRPLLIARCYDCHSGAKTKGGLSLDTRAGWQKGGESGAAIVPGKPEESLLIKAVSYQDADLAMPPESKGGKLPDADIAVLSEWVKRGAAGPSHQRGTARRDEAGRRPDVVGLSTAPHGREGSVEREDR